MLEWFSRELIDCRHDANTDQARHYSSIWPMPFYRTALVTQGFVDSAPWQVPGPHAHLLLWQ